MSIDETFGNFFKPESKSSGRKLFSQDKVSIANGSDTSIEAFVRVAPPLKVRLSTEAIESEAFAASCTCPAGKKGRFCKHVWATLLCVEEKYPDFLSAKQVIEKPSAAPESSEPLEAAEEEKARSFSEKQESYKAAAKERASLYRKVQYQKQKLRKKQQKLNRQGREAPVETSVFPPEVDAALSYFSLNGFPMPAGPEEEVLAEAKKKLSRVFHPDKGGSHAEIIELNRNVELLFEFLHGRSERKVGYMGADADMDEGDEPGEMD